MTKNRAITIKKAHQRREKIKAFLATQSDYLYIKDIADKCGYQTEDISNDLKELYNQGFLSRKDDKSSHPKRVMYKPKQKSSAARKNSVPASKVPTAASSPESQAVVKAQSKTVGKPALESQALTYKEVKETALVKTAAKAEQTEKNTALKPEPDQVVASKETVDADKSLPASTTHKTQTSAVKSHSSSQVAAASKRSATKQKPATAAKARKQPASKPVPRLRAVAGETQRKILNALAAGRPLSVPELCQQLNKQPSNMYKMLSQLFSEGQVERHRVGRTFYFQLTSGVKQRKPQPLPVGLAKPQPLSGEQLIDQLAATAKALWRLWLSAR